MTDLEITQLVDCPGISLESEHGGCSCLYAALDRMAAALQEEVRKPRLSIDQSRILDSWALESAAAKARIRDLESESEHLSSALSISEKRVATTHQTTLRLKDLEQENVSLRKQVHEERDKAEGAENQVERLATSMTRTLDWAEAEGKKSKEKIAQLEELVESLSSKTFSGERKIEGTKSTIKELQDAADAERTVAQKLRDTNISLQERVHLLEKFLGDAERKLNRFRDLVGELEIEKSKAQVLNNHIDHLKERVESLEAVLGENVHKLSEKELELADREDSINKLNQSLLAIKSVLKETP